MSKKIKKCWDFFQCRPDEQRLCLMAEVDDYRCWLVNLPCCKIGRDVPRPISIKKVVCKTCDYYKTYKI